MQRAENTRERMNLKLKYVLNLFAVESHSIVGHGVNTSIHSHGNAGQCVGKNPFKRMASQSSLSSSTAAERHRALQIKKQKSLGINSGNEVASQCSPVSPYNDTGMPASGIGGPSKNNVEGPIERTIAHYPTEL
ncbi:hypothetical protein TNCV_2109931 [Trichonephila clavipes]|nr:hypothetical protein TNCV_2109931 [Trichonephila clavipes]